MWCKLFLQFSKCGRRSENKTAIQDTSEFRECRKSSGNILEVQQTF